MSNEAVYRTAPATPGLLNSAYLNPCMPARRKLGNSQCRFYFNWSVLSVFKKVKKNVFPILFLKKNTDLSDVAGYFHI